MSITIKDIASEAGVSYSTVSKALNDSPLVKQSTKKHIVDIAEKMGYQPNFAAQKLVLKQTKIIGLIWPTIERIVLSTLVTEINKQINQTTYSMILSVDAVQASLETFRRFQVDGIILFEEGMDAAIESPNIPLLSYGVNGKFKRSYPLIDANHQQSMYQAVNYLSDLGHQSIAYIGDLSKSDRLQLEKYDGFKKAMHEADLPVHKHYLIDTKGLDWYDGYKAVKQLLSLQNQPTAIVGGSYDISIGIIRGIREKSLHIPDDFSIISCDNIPQMADLEVPLTSIGVPVKHLAQEIVSTIIKYVENKESEPIIKKLTPVLSKRESCAPRHQ